MEKESWPVPGNSLNHSTSATEVNPLSDFYQEVFRRLEHQEQAFRADIDKDTAAILDPGTMPPNWNLNSYLNMGSSVGSQKRNPTRMRKKSLGPVTKTTTQTPQPGEKAERESQPEYLYLLQAIGTDRFHIGLTNLIDQRFEELQRHSPFPLKLIINAYCPDPQAQELRLHKLFGEWRLHGQWFQLPPEVLSRVVEEFKQILESAVARAIGPSQLTLDAIEPEGSRLQERRSNKRIESRMDPSKAATNIDIKDKRQLCWLPLKTLFVAEVLEEHGFVCASNAEDYCVGSKETYCCGWKLSWLPGKIFNAFYDGVLWSKPLEALLFESDCEEELARVIDIIRHSCQEFDRLRAQSNGFYSL